MNILDNIKHIRSTKGFSQSDVAEFLGIAHTNYGRIERGLTELTVDRLFKIAEFLDVSVAELLSISNSNTESNPKIDDDFEFQKLKDDYKKLNDEFEEWRVDNRKLMDMYDLLKTFHLKTQYELQTILNRAGNFLNQLYSDTGMNLGYERDADKNFKLISKEVIRNNKIMFELLIDKLNIVEDSRWITAWVREKELYEMPKMEKIVALSKQYGETNEESFVRIITQNDKLRDYKYTKEEIEDALQKFKENITLYN